MYLYVNQNTVQDSVFLCTKHDLYVCQCASVFLLTLLYHTEYGRHLADHLASDSASNNRRLLSLILKGVVDGQTIEQSIENEASKSAIGTFEFHIIFYFIFTSFHHFTETYNFNERKKIKNMIYAYAKNV